MRRKPTVYDAEEGFDFEEECESRAEQSRAARRSVDDEARKGRARQAGRKRKAPSGTFAVGYVGGRGV